MKLLFFLIPLSMFSQFNTDNKQWNNKVEWSNSTNWNNGNKKESKSNVKQKTVASPQISLDTIKKPLVDNSIIKEEQFLAVDTTFLAQIESNFKTKKSQKPKEINSIALKFEELNNGSKYKHDYNAVTDIFVKKYLSYSWLPMVIALNDFYAPMLESKLKKYGIPTNFRYLAIVESAMNPRAGSHVGAKGLWQFMANTAQGYGLDWNQYVDERFDPIASTEAACKYLKNLHNQLGDWNLVLSSYNWGEGRIIRLKQKIGSNYWAMRNHMPNETKAYVPSFVAVSYIAQMGYLHGLNHFKFPIKYKEVKFIKTKNTTSFTELAKGKNEKIIKYLNPHILTDIIPADVLVYSY